MTAHIDGTPVSCLKVDHRAFQKEYIGLQKEPKDIALLGTSRSRQVHAALFPNQTFYNHQMDGSSLTDMPALIELMDQHKQLPETIILEMDFALFQREPGSEELSQALSPEADIILEKLNVKSVNNSWGSEWTNFRNKWKPLFSVLYLKRGFQNKSNTGPQLGEHIQTCDVKYPDGSG